MSACSIFTDRHVLPDAQAVTDVAEYVMSLPRFPRTSTGIGDGTALNEGAKVYFPAMRSCHGPLGEGDLLRRRSRLAGQHYVYCCASSKKRAGALRPGMDDAHVARLRKLSADRCAASRDYLSRLSPDLNSLGHR
jgi:hypothetical protein